jgi:hypothetical protein
VIADVSLSNFKSFCIREEHHPKYEELLSAFFLAGLKVKGSSLLISLNY